MVKGQIPESNNKKGIWGIKKGGNKNPPSQRSNLYDRGD